VRPPTEAATFKDDCLRRLEPHILPLTKLVDSLRSSGLDTPDVDPNNGGINAKVLFFLETPGPKAVNGLVSRDNLDPTARNFKSACDEVGLAREIMALWNVVPQCLSTPERSVNPTRAQIKAALPATLDFIGRFHNLRVIVFCGVSARYAMKKLDTGSVKKLGTYHTGNRAFHRFREHIRETFKAASELAAANQATPISKLGY
jgi:hypothetical protein